MRYLALDVGERRMGVALSDETGTIARSLTVIQRASRAEDLARLRDLIAAHGVGALVVGLPLDSDGQEGPQARRIRRYGQRAAVALDLPVVFWDESGSTVYAQEVLIQAGHRRRQRHQRLDAAAAAAILQDYLDHGPRGQSEDSAVRLETDQ
ncbi:MAG: Holliday junction resolvase RuvX [Chloroflexi bacterium]|nr:Holliday junction resolvase RuvX [Chloroflexota bacterium]MBU1751028.1 Holliday junction resolvase RuvX [Chloroflexota bacterium]MBU1878934.1 Holliday junction resolvase RuvX [Chloroflexota bacterium]